MNEQLQIIIRELEEYGLEDLTDYGADAWTEKIWWLIEQLQQTQAKVKHLENTIKETLDTLKRGGPGTRSQVQRLLEKALEGEVK